MNREAYLGDSGVEELSSNTYVLGDTPVPLRYAADWEGGSSVGGFAFGSRTVRSNTAPIAES